MLIGTLDEVEFAPEYPELVGKRVAGVIQETQHAQEAMV